MNSILESKLESIGLGEKEAKVYLAAMDLGPATAKQIAQKANVNRATTYVQIESLMEKGLMSSFDKGKKTFFNAESPEHLFRFIEKQKNETLQKENILKEAFVELKGVFEYSGERPKVRFFEGKEGIEAIQEEFLKNKPKSAFTFAPLDEAYKVFPPEPTDYRNKFSKKLPDILMKIIYTTKEKNEPAQSFKNMEKRFIPPDKFPFTTEITIYNDKIILISWAAKLIGIIVENKDMANSLRSIFNLTWEAAEKYNK